MDRLTPMVAFAELTKLVDTSLSTHPLLFSAAVTPSSSLPPLSHTMEPPSTKKRLFFVPTPPSIEKLAVFSANWAWTSPAVLLPTSVWNK